MGNNTTIEWTDATWNPVTGCTKVSTGCENCYAADLAAWRLRDSYLRRLPVLDTPENRKDPFAVRIWPERLNAPETWLDSRMVFVNSMSDLFHAEIPEEYVVQIFEVMLREDRHTYQILTKRPSRARRFLESHRGTLFADLVPPHIWLGTSVEKEEVLHRVRQLRAVPASLRFLSCEPLLGPLELDLDGIHWVIAGGESGPRFRPMELDWVQGIRTQCLKSGVPFFFKQVGGRTPKAGGRILDGRTWDEYPMAVARL